MLSSSKEYGGESMINFDLHIHSIASRYKEGKDIVDNSTVENAETLLTKLNEHNVNLFSITDHNRFNIDLYERLDLLVNSQQFPNVYGLVAGVEFDVQIDTTMEKCHIITIFDAKNRRENYKKIYNAIAKNKIEDKNGSYSRKEYEDILRDIGMDVILIACQRNSLDRHDGKHNSLSESTMDSEQLLLTGYINALEFQKPNVEGILRDNLKVIPKSVMLVMGSDCHDWSVYPNHDKKNGNNQFMHSRANILPTFKGLLMAVTSPETRINQQENRNRDYIKSLTVGGKKYPLINGINAIIGENGSGKSTLLKLLHNQKRERHVKNLLEENGMFCENVDSSKRMYIGQGDIVEKFDSNKLFPNENFNSVDNTEFQSTYTDFADGILKYIRKRIKAQEAFDQLVKEELEYNELINDTTYFIHVDINADYADVDNIHNHHNQELKKLLYKISAMLVNEYYQDYSEELSTIYSLLLKIYTRVHDAHAKVELEKIVKNAIISALDTYDERVGTAATSRERDQRDYREKKQSFVSLIIDAIKKNADENSFPEVPKPIYGFSTNPKYGFSFNSETEYHGKNVVEEFLSQMFIRAYANIESLKRINTMEKLVDAVKGCTDPDQVDMLYKKNLNAFLDEMCSCKNYIVDISQGTETLGNTLGELSLAYFKYMTEYETEKCVFLIDQPEDHISNNNISKKLLTYFNSIRNKKQVIIVTHNPLLVVNQDVDQVLFVKKLNDKIEVVAGCLEYEADGISILDIVANNMDGGKDSIEKRLKVYGKENYSKDVIV